MTELNHLREISPASTLSTRWLIFLLEKARPFSQGRLLDVGCGPKPYQGFFQATQHLGMDWPSSFHNIDIDVFADAQTIPFACHVFDTVLSTEVIEHLQNPRQAVNEMARVLCPGGYLILSAPFVHVLHEIPYDYYRFTSFGLQSLLSQSGLNLVDCWPRGGIFTVMMDIFGRFLIGLIRSLSRRFPGGIKKVLETALVALFISWPQTLFSILVITLSQKSESWKFLRILDTSSKLTLGYVCVAQKPMEKL